MAGAGHKSIRPGKMALIRFHDSRPPAIDRFLEDRDRFLVFKELGRVPSEEIRTVSEYRPHEGSMLRGEAEKKMCVLCGNTYQAREAQRTIVVHGKVVCRPCQREIAEAL